MRVTHFTFRWPSFDLYCGSLRRMARLRPGIYRNGRCPLRIMKSRTLYKRGVSCDLGERNYFFLCFGEEKAISWIGDGLDETE